MGLLLLQKVAPKASLSTDLCEDFLPNRPKMTLIFLICSKCPIFAPPPLVWKNNHQNRGEPSYTFVRHFGALWSDFLRFWAISAPIWTEVDVIVDTSRRPASAKGASEKKLTILLWFWAKLPKVARFGRPQSSEFTRFAADSPANGLFLRVRDIGSSPTSPSLLQFRHKQPLGGMGGGRDLPCFPRPRFD